MTDTEERLYYACTQFCEAFFKLLCEKDKLRSRWVSDNEKEVRLQFSNDRLNSAYERLFRAVEDWENENKGVIGPNQYQLELKRIER